VLLAEAQGGLRTRLCRALRDAGYEVTELADGASLWNELRLLNDPKMVGDPYTEPAAAVDLIVSDVQLPGLGGPELLARLRTNGWDAPVMLVDISGGSPAVQGACLGATKVFELPLDVPGLVAAARSLVDPTTSREA
jgi:DNA-binding response OmpR family regulator